MPRKEGVVGTVKERLLKRRQIEGDCWLWTGAIDSNGYGQFRYQGKTISVHKIAAMIFLGYDLSKSSSSYQINHKCSKRTCFNPEHLYIGSQSRNVADAWRDGTFHGKARTNERL